MAKIDEDLIRYPFLRRAREVLAETSPEDSGLPRSEIIDQARYRMERALRNADTDIQKMKRWPQYRDFASRTGRTDVLDDVVDFYSFFVAVQASAKDSFVTTCLGKAEAQRSKTFFFREGAADRVRVFHEATGLTFTPEPEGSSGCPVETYLAFASERDLFEDPRWKLTRLPLDHGVIHFSQNRILDLFTSIVNSLMATGMKALRTQPIRADVMLLVREMEPFIPRRDAGNRANYGYIEELLKHKVSDGRHRLAWLVLAPYLVNIKGIDENAAVETIIEYIGDTRYRQFVRYQVRRAARQGILPPSVSTLKSRHSDLYAILNREALVA